MQRRAKFRRRWFRPIVEQLEDRRLLAAVITVNSTADSNTRDALLTLREAILINNRSLTVASLSAAELLQVVGLPTNADADTIRFDIPPTDAGHVYYKSNAATSSVSLANVAATTAAEDTAIADIDPDWPHSWYSIKPTSALPDIRESVTIDGYSQGSGTPSTSDDAAANTLPAGGGLNSVLRVEIDGSLAGDIASGMFNFVASGGNSTLRGLTINRVAGVKVILSDDAGSSPGNSRVEGNYIGSDISGTVAFPPPTIVGSGISGDGLAIGSSNNTIGGLTPAARNLISGNPVSGIVLGFGHQVQGNLIGTDRSASRALGNGRWGVQPVFGGTTIGGTSAAAGNVIAGNLAGIYGGGTIQNNWIGTNAAGAENLGNKAVGVVISLNQSNSKIVENSIAFNGFAAPSSGFGGTTSPAGVRVLGGVDSTVGNGNLIGRNSIYSNFGPGIDPGPNLRLQNSPVLTSVTDLNPGTRIQGTLASLRNSNFRLEFFANSERDESTNGVAGAGSEGKTFIGTLDLTTDAAGLATFSIDLPPLPAGQPFVTATATDITDAGSGPKNNTSAFSQVAVVGGCSFTVTTTADQGLGTLREAIHCSDLIAGRQIITFAIPANDPRHFYYRDDAIAGSVSVENISSTSAADDASLPTSGVAGVDPDWPHSWFSIRPTRELTVAFGTLVVDGYSQAGARFNTLPAPQGLNTVLKIELDGSGSGGNGLRIMGTGVLSQVMGLAINRWSASGIVLSSDGTSFVQGNFVGSDVSGTVNYGNGEYGVFVDDETFSSIGEDVPQARNLISGNQIAGVYLRHGGGHEIDGNLIGLNRNLTKAMPNRAGVLVESSLSSMGKSAGNVVSSQGEYAVGVRNPAGAAQGVAGVAGLVGVATITEEQLALFKKCLDAKKTVDDLEDLQILRVTPLLYAFPQQFDDYDNASRIYDACSKQLERQGIIKSEWDITDLTLLRLEPEASSYDPPLLDYPPIPTPTPTVSVDLNADGVTSNDPGNSTLAVTVPDSDDGPNGLQNFPDIVSATAIAGGATVVGTLRSLPQESFRIDLYANAIGTSFRAGEQFLGSTQVTTDAQGKATFVFGAASPLRPDQFVTSTATWLLDIDDTPQRRLVPVETSEFSNVIAVRQNPWHNQAKALDVVADGKAVAADALEIINYINAFGSGLVPPNAQLGVPFYYDTNNDAFVAPNDALGVIDFINAFGPDAEGEGSPGESPPGHSSALALPNHALQSDLLAFLAADLATQPRRRSG